MSQAEGVLITGAHGSGQSSVAAEIAYLLEQQDQPYALLDLDHLSWTGPRHRRPRRRTRPAGP